MVAGLNLRVTVWRMVEQTDDDVGGAMISGTPYLEHQDARIAALKPHPLLMQQGLEVDSLFRCLLRGSHQDVREYDEIEVVWPTQHKYYGQRFRIKKVQEDSLHPLDRRNMMEFVLSRIEYSRSEQ